MGRFGSLDECFVGGAVVLERSEILVLDYGIKQV